MNRRITRRSHLDCRVLFTLEAAASRDLEDEGVTVVVGLG